MILHVFDSRVPWSQVDVLVIIDSLARIFDSDAKVRDVIKKLIFTVFNGKWSFGWTSQENPFRRSFSFSAADVLCFIKHAFKPCPFVIDLLISPEFFIALNNLTLMVFKLGSYKYTSTIKPRYFDIHIEALHLSDYHFALHAVNGKIHLCMFANMKWILLVTAVNRTVLSLLCSLLKLSKHYSSVLIVAPRITDIIREYEFWWIGKPLIWNCCEARRYYWQVWIDDTRDSGRL